MVDTIAILHKEEDVIKYKKGDFGWHAYMTGSPLEVEHGMSSKEHPAVFTAKSGTLLNFSLNGAGRHCHASTCSHQYCRKVLKTCPAC